MQLRHLRYFVSIVEAGSFSRAATTIHVAQPALSQQIAELEEKLGLSLLQRSARGVRPTAAGEVLYREASSILRQMAQLPGIVRSSSGEAVGTVGLGMSSTLAASLAGRIVDTCRANLPRVTLKLAVADSETIRARVESHSLDMALVFEDEMVPAFARKLLFRQRLYLVPSQTTNVPGAVISLAELARLPLVLPDQANVTRRMLDRVFDAAGLRPAIMVEADQFSGLLSAVRTGIGATIIPMGALDQSAGSGLAQPILIEPPLHLTASIISSSDYPLTHAGEAVRGALIQIIHDHLQQTRPAGTTWIGGSQP
ncbi:LysR family transcriptional regulator [Bosea caraganae]|uniref:LysR family transcriptional regulator n=2 Tax=Bosea caraganae TaxID=2763117 RepID=A0A370LAN9_9HYPH|nr:LysR substrate-binding domain-containing protein [Bosea caraganae]RDJ27026.1 LysR family transcriptional regulator [Bosea caraganae]RDJ29043.1 LysR family transcriptional regulator [Bosea caraganae]